MCIVDTAVALADYRVDTSAWMDVTFMRFEMSRSTTAKIITPRDGGESCHARDFAYKNIFIYSFTHIQSGIVKYDIRARSDHILTLDFGNCGF